MQPITAAVIPVAGLGTRLLPATKSQPKVMLPVVDVPVVQYVVAELARAGIERVLFVTGRRKRAIEDHFDIDSELAHALDGRPIPDPSAGLEVLYVRPAPGDAQPIVRRIYQAYADYRADAVLAVEDVPVELVSRHGIVAPRAWLDPQRVLEVDGLVEKPAPPDAPSQLAVAARYVLGPPCSPLCAMYRPARPERSSWPTRSAAFSPTVAG